MAARPAGSPPLLAATRILWWARGREEIVAGASTTRDEARRNTRARFEQWAKNPKCEANTLSAVHNVRVDKAAEAMGIDPSFGQSPFAIARGNSFEWGLFVDGAQRIRQALERKEVLADGSRGFLDLRLRMNGGERISTVDDALGATETWLREIAEDPSTAPSIVAAPMVRIPRGVILPEALLIIDIVTATVEQGRATLTVGEIKVFPDRGGHTDRGQLASARAQAGLYRRALEMATHALGLSERVSVAPSGFLVFTWPGSNQPAIRPNEDLTYQAIRAERGFARLEEVAQAIVREDDFAADQPELIRRVLDAETSYSEACLSFCDLAPRCHAHAVDADDAIVLGSEAARILGDVSMRRAIQLMNGAEPTDEVEADVQRQLAGP